MDSKFEFFVEIRDQKYEIVLNENNSSLLTFSDIYPKLQQIVKIAIKEDIDYKTHEFEVFENNSTNGSVIQVIDQIVKHNSLISIKPKSLVNLPIGATVGAAVGATVGAAVGATVGAAVGATVGAAVGANQMTGIAIRFPLLFESSKEEQPKPLLLYTYARTPKTTPLASVKSTIIKPIVTQLTELSEPTPQSVEVQPQPKPQNVSSVSTNCIPLLTPTNNPIIKYSTKPKSSPSKSEQSSSINQRIFKCDVCPDLVDNPLYRGLLQHELKLNEKTYKRYIYLIKTVYGVCNKKYHSLTTNDWNEVIPKIMNDLGYKKFTPEKWKNSFHTLLEKYSQVLKVSPNSEMACNLFPFFHLFNSFVFESKEYFFRRIRELQQKLKINSNQSKSSSDKRSVDDCHNNPDANSCPKRPATVSPKRPATVSPKRPATVSPKRPATVSPKRPAKRLNTTKVLNEFTQRLILSEKNIEFFHSMVKQMRIEWNFLGNDKYWELLVDRMCETKTKYSFITTSNMCKTSFYIWTQFYAQNYDTLNGKLEPNGQKIFDLFKIVHTLDLTQLFTTESTTYKKLKEIFLREELQDYFNTNLNLIRMNKVKDKVIEDSHREYQTFVLKERPKNLSPKKIKVFNKSGNNGRKLNNSSNTEKDVLNDQRSNGKELNFIPLSQGPNQRLKKVIDRAKLILSKQSTNQSKDNIRRIFTQQYRQIKPKVIETIVLD